MGWIETCSEAEVDVLAATLRPAVDLWRLTLPALVRIHIFREAWAEVGRLPGHAALSLAQPSCTALFWRIHQLILEPVLLDIEHLIVDVLLLARFCPFFRLGPALSQLALPSLSEVLACACGRNHVGVLIERHLRGGFDEHSGRGVDHT